MPTPNEILADALAKAEQFGVAPAVADKDARSRIEYVSTCLSNRAGVRLLMSCLLAKLHRPEIDPRKPYTEIGSPDSFSGRTYDEQYLTSFITVNRLPCNSTTAFLTPALRNQDAMFTTETVLVGRPPKVYSDALQLLDDVANGRLSAHDVLVETVRHLILLRDENRARMESLKARLKHDKDGLPLASEQIVTLLGQHLACRRSSRLPVLVVAAAYQAVSANWGECARPLRGHLAADKQTGAGGDVEICLTNDDRVCTIYEMKSKRITADDIDVALQKIAERSPRIDNYVFITTEAIDDRVAEYAAGMYEQTFGTEIAILDCIGFVRHFLHLFHRHRIRFLDAYQSLVLNEPDSAVNQPLKEAFLTLRQAAESDE